jgi:asparagine synthase (glutamine-hydrolysing)
MCGIAGMAGVADRELMGRMLARIRHRGPDDSGMYASNSGESAGCAVLGNNRLSILDLSSKGHQPMSNGDGNIWVAYNGEIFNFRELRAELQADGYPFYSETDTEILPHLFEKYGPAMVNRLNGMFAFAVWDGRTQELLLFRDRMGVKPLYYTQVGNRLYFASETKALFECDEVRFELDRSALPEFLSLLYVPNPGTMLKGIQKLPPGCVLHWKNGEIHVDRFWKASYGPMFQEPEEDLASELRKRLVAATERQLISDVPVGFFLSGGLDSTTLLACAAQSHSNLKCYSIQFKDEHGKLEQSDEDAQYAQAVAKHFGAHFQTMLVEPRLVDWLPEVIYHLDDPVADHAAIATYLICKTAKPNATVLLSGQGGDEVFAGYRAHIVPKFSRWLSRAPTSLRNVTSDQMLPLLARHANKIPGASPGLVLAFARHMRRLLEVANLQPRAQYTFVRSYFQPEDLQALLSPEVRNEVQLDAAALQFDRLFDEVRDEDFLNQMLYVDCNSFLPDLNLAYTDKLSMACSIEARVPMLDNELVDFMLRVPPKLKIKGTTQKYLLRKAVQGMVPDSVIRRRKAGFGLPVRSWIRNELREMVGDLLSESRVRERGLFDPREVTRILAANERSERDYTLPIWALLTIEIWLQTFVDQSQRIEHAVVVQ